MSVDPMSPALARLRQRVHALGHGRRPEPHRSGPQVQRREGLTHWRGWCRAYRACASELGLLGVLVMGAAAALPAAAAPSYTADPAQSRLEFTGTQAGASFQGVFHQFTAAVDFAPDALATSRFDVIIDLGSLDTRDKDRDGTMRGADLFDVGKWPTAHYVTRGFTKTATGYAATGTLTLRGVSRDVPLEFRFTTTPTGAKLEGTASLKRLDFGVGQGQWNNTDMVADAVKVGFSLVLKPKS